MATIGQVLVDQQQETRKWTLKLLEDFSGDDWLVQVKPGFQHALWICGHLACAEDLLLFQRVLGEKSRLDEGFVRHFGIGGPVPSAKEHDWPDPSVVLTKMEEVQRAALQTLVEIPEGILSEPAYGKDGAVHPHYKTKLGAISHISRHEAFHAGQLATIRRLQEKPFLR